MSDQVTDIFRGCHERGFWAAKDCPDGTEVYMIFSVSDPKELVVTTASENCPALTKPAAVARLLKREFGKVQARVRSERLEKKGKPFTGKVVSMERLARVLDEKKRGAADVQGAKEAKSAAAKAAAVEKSAKAEAAKAKKDAKAEAQARKDAQASEAAGGGPVSASAMGAGPGIGEGV